MYSNSISTLIRQDLANPLPQNFSKSGRKLELQFPNLNCRKNCQRQLQTFKNKSAFKLNSRNYPRRRRNQRRETEKKSFFIKTRKRKKRKTHGGIFSLQVSKKFPELKKVKRNGKYPEFKTTEMGYSQGEKPFDSFFPRSRNTANLISVFVSKSEKPRKFKKEEENNSKFLKRQKKVSLNGEASLEEKIRLLYGSPSESEKSSSRQVRRKLRSSSHPNPKKKFVERIGGKLYEPWNGKDNIKNKMKLFLGRKFGYNLMKKNPVLDNLKEVEKFFLKQRSKSVKAENNNSILYEF